MKRMTAFIVFLCGLLYSVPIASGIPIDEATFPDNNLRSFISGVWDHGYSNSDGEWVADISR